MTSRLVVALSWGGLAGCGGIPSADQCGSRSGTVILSGLLDSDTELVCPDVRYFVESDLQVAGGATLTVGAGVTVTVAPGATIGIGGETPGALVADGTDVPIVFTADGGEAAPWRGIVVNATATGAVLRNVTIEFAGATTSGPPTRGAALSVASEAEVVGSSFIGSLGAGVRFGEEGRAVAFEANRFEGNGAEMVSIYGNHVGSLGRSNASSTPRDGVRVEGDVIDTSAMWLDPGPAYYVAGDLRVEGDSEPLLEIEGGVELRFGEAASLGVGVDGAGGIRAAGSRTDRIVFTGDAVKPSPGDWEGILVSGQATTAVFRYVDVRFAGDAQFGGSVAVQAGLSVLDGVEATIEDSRFYDNAGAGVRLAAGGRASSFLDNDFRDNLEHAMRIDANEVGTLDGLNTFGKTDRIFVDGDVVAADATWRPIGAPYLLESDTFVQGAAAPVLTLAPGVTLLMGSDVSIHVGLDEPGGIVAEGTNTEPVLLSSAGTRLAGDWEGVFIDSNGSGRFDYAELEFCGDTTSDASQEFAACLGIVGPTRAVVQRSTFRRSATNGIELELGGTFDDPFGFSNFFSFIAGDPILID